MALFDIPAFLVQGFCLRLAILAENEASCKIADTMKLGFLYQAHLEKQYEMIQL